MSNSKSLAIAPRIGEGIYSTIEVAEILNLPYHQVKNLMRGFWRTHTFGHERNKSINFFSLIEFYIYYYLREHGFTAQWIKKLHNDLKIDFDTPYPFASLKIKPHKKISGKKKPEVWIDFRDCLMMADRKLQPSFRSFIEPFLDQIEYDNDFLAKRYFPLKKSRNVVVDPKKQFGKPIIEGSGVRTDVIYRYHLGGEKIENICNLYDLKPEQVRDAIQFHELAA